MLTGSPSFVNIDWWPRYLNDGKQQLGNRLERDIAGQAPVVT
jgi:hypothetical protein